MTTKIEEIMKADMWVDMWLPTERYHFEAIELERLAVHQLNSDKNRVKPPIEEMSYSEILDKIDEELNELKAEFLAYLIELDKKRVLEEVGDIAGMLCGLIKKIKEEGE